MTEFEKAVYERLNAAKKEGEEDIRKTIIKDLEEEFLNLTPAYIFPDTEVNSLIAETIWIVFAGYKETKSQYRLTFNRKEKVFESYEEVEKFAKEIISLFPSENITCHVLNTLEWQKIHRIGGRVFGLEFSLNIKELIKED